MEEALKQEPTKIIKIALYGPESTGKTTLAKQLAKHYTTTWIPEFARDYLQQKWDSSKQICTEDDLLPIAVGQIKLENEALHSANQVLFVDTTLLVTKVFSDLYYGKTGAVLEQAAKEHTYDLFLLTDVDVPWQKDDLRDSPENREQTLQQFEKALIDLKKPYIKVSGAKEARLNKAIAIIDELKQAKEFGFTSTDFVQLYYHTVSVSKIIKQVAFLKEGIPHAALNRVAKIGDGIETLSAEGANYFSNLFDSKKEHLKLKKFVPASGAASRMFKFLLEFLQDFNPETESINAYINRKKARNVTLFLIGMEKFPFYKEILKATKNKYPEYSQWSKDKKDYAFIKTMLSESDFNFSNKPKGILPFHHYPTHIATPIEEHLIEASIYGSSNSKAYVHFTISEEHQKAFDAIVDKVKPKIEDQNAIRINVNYSYQNQATDSLAFDMNNNPFRDENGNLIFRPGGHGALLENLNQIDADLVFIKNIDNIIQNHVATIALYKKALAGVLLEKQQKVFHYLRELDAHQLTKDTIYEVVEFLETQFNIEVSDDFAMFTKQSKIDYLHKLLNRPIRVCGMVKNEGEPGGGPFWVTNNKGQVFLQIVETSQIDTADAHQAKILENATHFNPVDLVCGIRNYKGSRFDLMQFVDYNSGFIVYKNKGGKDLKAYELPGLWNGGMAKWLTVFVEVPLITFNPVKTVNDLLKAPHQPQ
ncbi:DUF4301 family protein [Flavobacterium orientale]|uniref:NAD metabolism ATPase/kinase n=1 Tax=Flavobacterium orientale TaxID=1756020 RepID=A0A916XY24_9FLAO|nr:DUF4301 family protein [Flavobacterium orientale]GGD18763.1 NAD metabolism ATPase/kinase [Flavobacterium orientale]